MMSFSKDAVSPPPSQPAACSTRLAPPIRQPHSDIDAFIGRLRVDVIGGGDVARAERHADERGELAR